MSKLTALDWFIETISKLGYVSADIAKQAKQMEKEQILESYCQGCADIIKEENIFPRETSEKYFQEIYGGQDEQSSR